MFAAAGMFVWIHAPILAQESFDPSTIENLINQFIAGQAPTSTSITALSVIPNPAQTEEIIIATAELANPSLAANAAFTWYVNGERRPDLSGVAQSTTSFVAPKNPGFLRIGVEMRMGTSSSTAETVVPLETSATTQLFQQLEAQADTLIARRREAESQGTVSVEQSPLEPRPGDPVTFTANSFQFDISQSDITWVVNGKPAASGKGLATFTMVAGQAGTVSEVEARVNAATGESAVRSISVVPAQIRFYWWANTYVPLWYRGKAMPSSGSRIFIEAIPSFPEAIRNALTYTWFINDAMVREASGPGKSVIAYTIPSTSALRSSIRVRVTNAAETVNASAEFPVPLGQPEALVYEAKPLAGIDYANAIQSITREAGRPVEIIVEPFFVPRQALASLHYSWNLNGKEIDAANDPRPRRFTLTSTEETTGIQTFGVSFEDLAERALGAAHVFNVTLE